MKEVEKERKKQKLARVDDELEKKKVEEKSFSHSPDSRSHLVHILGPNGSRDGGGDRRDAAPAVIALARGAKDAQRVEKLLLLGGLPLLSLSLCGCRMIEKEKTGFAVFYG